VQKKAALLASKQEAMENIRELGAISEESRTKYRTMDSNAIVKRLQKVKESLKKYSSVNKHAFEHYRKSTKQREDLDSRRKDLETAKASIQNLIEVLDQRKDEAIERTFKQVSKAFAEVFQKLVPAGRGRLIIQRKTDARQAEDDESDEESSNKRGVENYTGVGISVSFNSKHDDQQRIQQLSGGQKSMIKLSIWIVHLLTRSSQVYAVSLSSSPSRRLIRHPFTFSTRSMPTLMHNTVPLWRTT
jgi:structural maintenance of chromosome 3 (chondroitin sulfate proteoglycan 6)